VRSGPSPAATPGERRPRTDGRDGGGGTRAAARPPAPRSRCADPDREWDARRTARPTATGDEEVTRFGRRVMVGVVALAVAVAPVVAGAVVATGLPSTRAAPAEAAHLVVAEGGEPVGVPPPRRIAAALMASEDHLYGLAPGVDIAYGAARWVAGRLAGHRNVGGSTLAQQLAKMLYTGPTDSVPVKLEQLALALELEVRYSPASLLSAYLDVAYFGDGVYGVERASEHYFGCPPSGLSWGEAALLAGMVQAPSADDPITHPAAARRRQREVLSELVRVGFLTPAAARRAAEAPLACRTFGARPVASARRSGIATDGLDP